MGISALTPPPLPDNVQETLLVLEDNRLLIELCGQYDRNLAQLENALGVSILRRGNQLALLGDPTARLQGLEILQALYARLETGKPVDSGEIDAMIRMGAATGAPAALEQMDMFGGAPVELRTRRK